jgi:uncharacterized membrane protein YvbJ
MALIKCPECGTEVSDKAPQCPKCSYPISTIPAGQKVEDVQTIQQTSKRFKKQIIIAVILLIGGIIVLAIGADGKRYGLAGVGILAIILGVVWYIIVRIRIWWHHK